MTIMPLFYSKSIVICFSLQFFLLLFANGLPGSIVETLPGIEGVLSVKLETGYVSVNESELFYLFVESQGKPQDDPLLVYLAGGPGCSALTAFFFQVGPLIFNTTDYLGGLPELLYNPYSWTKTASIIFVDYPVGTGYSYTTSSEDYHMTDTTSAKQVHQFLRNVSETWLVDHPEFTKVPFFIASDSYAGIITPIVGKEILDGNEAGLQPQINLKGFVSGSPHADTALELNSAVPFAYRLALISRSLYESAKNSCKGNYVDVDPSNAPCLEDLEIINQCVEQINKDSILDSKCAGLSSKSNNKEQSRRFLKENSQRFLVPYPKTQNYWCQNFEYVLVDVWANDERVQDALHVRRGTVRTWYRCNSFLKDVLYTYDVFSAVDYYRNLTRTGLRILLYSGDHDMVVPYISTEKWINSLNITVDEVWRPWFVEGQVAGYTVKYTDYGFRLTFTTVKGAGHSPTLYMPRWCFKMFERWIHYYPL
ncbi:hypothetical protein SADUNF_Sadunf16G0191100 [Salix dunnii]|uniref:Serine carboxypeptidase-like 18 n=1 Tax=Salix dunnii TaxID=1413687 RepID=A0A835J9C9_9ROSI|nr:hypothetical protein SADUNF_Sadunf16G0191100 [Salix dunnii]